MVAPTDQRDRVEATEHEVTGRLVEAAAGVEHGLQRGPSPVRLTDEPGRAHDVVAVAGTLHHQHAIVPRQGLQILEREGARLADAGDVQAVALGIDLGVPMAVATEVTVVRRDRTRHVVQRLLDHADHAERDRMQQPTEPARHTLDRKELELFGGVRFREGLLAAGEGAAGVCGARVGHDGVTPAHRPRAAARAILGTVAASAPPGKPSAS